MKRLPATSTDIVTHTKADVVGAARVRRPGTRTVALARPAPATLAPIRALPSRAEGIDTDSYQLHCDAMCSSVAWLAEDIEARDIDELRESLETLEEGIAASAPVLAQLKDLASRIRAALKYYDAHQAQEGAIVKR